MADSDNSAYIKRWDFVTGREEYFAGESWYKAAIPTKDFTGIHADIPATTIFTPPVTGMYLVSFYGVTTTAATGADAAPNVYLRWTDDGGAQAYFNFAGNLDQVHSDGANQISIPCYCMANTPITFSALQGVYSGTVRWSFHVTVTAL